MPSHQSPADKMWDASFAERLSDATISAPLSADVALDTLGLVRRCGFALVNSPAADLTDAAIAARRRELLAFGGALGTPMFQSLRHELVEDVKDFSDVETGDDRGYRSGGELKPHSDPPTLLVLHCVQPAKLGGGSSLVSVASIVERMSTFDALLLNELFRPLPDWNIAGQNGATHAGPSAMPRAVLTIRDGAVSCVLYRPFIERAAHRLGITLTPTQVAALDLFEACSADDDLTLRFVLRPGQTLVLHNRSVLHSRTDYTDWPELHRRRHFLRLWIDAPESFPTDPSHALGDLFAPAPHV
jgi:hypothetical protein